MDSRRKHHQFESNFPLEMEEAKKHITDYFMVTVTCFIIFRLLLLLLFWTFFMLKIMLCGSFLSIKSCYLYVVRIIIFLT